MTFSSSSLRLRPRRRGAAGPWAKVDGPRTVVTMWVYWCASSSWALRLAAASRRASIESWGMTVNTTSQSWFARQGSPEVFITYRTHEHRTLFRARNRLLGRFSGALDIHNNPGARPLFRHPCVGPHNGGDVVLVCLRTRTARRHLRSGLVPRRGNARRPHRDAWHPGATAPRHWRPPAARSRRLHLRSRCWDAGRARHRSLPRRPCPLYRLRECRHWHERLIRAD